MRRPAAPSDPGTRGHRTGLPGAPAWSELVINGHSCDTRQASDGFKADGAEASSGHRKLTGRGNNASPRVVSGHLLLAQPVRTWTHRLLTFTGRRSGRSYTTPVAHIEQGDTLLIAGGAPWWKNLRSGRQRLASPEVISDAGELTQVLQIVLPLNKVLGRFTGIQVGPDGRPDSATIERAWVAA